MNPSVEHLINEYMQKMRDEYFKKEDKAKEIIEFLNSNFSDYINTIHHALDTDEVDIYFKDSTKEYMLPRSITWEKNQDGKIKYRFYCGIREENIVNLIPEICKFISEIKFQEELEVYKKAKFAKEPKKPWWKFWA